MLCMKSGLGLDEFTFHPNQGLFLALCSEISTVGLEDSKEGPGVVSKSAGCKTNVLNTDLLSCSSLMIYLIRVCSFFFG